MMEVARIKQELKQFQEAVMTLRDLDAKIPAGDEQKLEIVYMIADCYNASGDSEEAIKTLQSMLPMSPQNSAWKLESIRKMGEIYEKQEKWKEAAEVYESAGKIGDPQIAASFKERARYLRQTFLGEVIESAPPAKKKK
jgi:tetratricopeptide (TPR) repeat protein